MAKTTTNKDIFYPQLKLIAKKYNIDLGCKEGYIAAYRILEGKGLSFN